MWPPTRYTASRPRVKSTRLRRSATEKMFFRLSASIGLHPARLEAGPTGELRQHLGLAACCRAFFRCLAAELVRLHGERLADVAARENLDAAGAPRETMLAQELGCHFRARIEPLGDRIEVHHLVLHAERIVESTLRHPAVQRHLSAFEPALVLEARARLRAFVPAARGLAVARALPAADPLLGVLRAPGRAEVAQIHDFLLRLPPG